MNTESKGTHSNETSEKATSTASSKKSYGQLFFLGAMALFFTVFTPLTMLAPYPVTMSFLLYGNIGGGILSVIGTAVMYFYGLKFDAALFYTLFFVMISGYGLYVSTLIRKNIHPVLIVLRTGAVLALATALGYMYLSSNKVEVTESLTAVVTELVTTIEENNKDLLKGGGEDARALEGIIKNPSTIIEQFFNFGPVFVFMFLVFELWLTVLLVLRNSRPWRKVSQYKYWSSDFLKFQVPEMGIFIVIASMVLMLLGESENMSKQVGVFGVVLLYSIGIFYFFQGLGIYLDFVKGLRAPRFFKTLLTILTVVIAYKVLAIVGILDFKLNFRKFFKKDLEKNDEGDQI